MRKYLTTLLLLILGFAHIVGNLWLPDLVRFPLWFEVVFFLCIIFGIYLVCSEKSEMK